MLIPTISDDTLQAYYLDYLNNFLTVQYFADYYKFSTYTAQGLIDKGRAVHNQRTSK